MANAVLNNQNYLNARDSLLRKNEGFSTQIYFDTNGIPTFGVGVALLTAKGAINNDNLNLIANILGTNSAEFAKIQTFAQRASEAVLGTPSMGVARNVTQFLSTERGQAIVEEFGVSISYVKGSGFVLNGIDATISNTSALAVSSAAANVRESQLDKVIVRAGGNPQVLTIAERSVLLDVLYQNGSGSKTLKNAVSNFFNYGQDDARLLSDISSSNYPARAINGATLFSDSLYASTLAVSQESKDTVLDETIKNIKDTLFGHNDSQSNTLNKIWDWVSNELFGSSNTTLPITKTTAGTITTLSGTNSSVTINHSAKTVKVPVTTSSSLPTGNIGHTSGEVGMFTTYNMVTGEVLAVESASENISSSINSTIFNLAVDVISLNPVDAQALGTTTHGWSLLGGGAGYEFEMTSPYVNNSGGSYVSSSFITAEGIRPGNHSLSDFGRFMNAVRSTLYDVTNTNTFNSGMLLNALDAYNSVAYIDPIALDGGNDGILFSAAPVNFDYDSDGAEEALLWTAPTDPLLVMDLNGDGRINNGTELVDLTDSGKPLNLFTLDDNGDKKLDQNDQGYWDLQIWSDRNQDGYASAGELQSLSDLGITSIDLDPNHIISQTIAGKPNIKGVKATYSDGSSRTMWDVPFDAINSTTNPVTTTSYSANINKVSSAGQTALQATSSLGVTISLDGSGATQAIGSLGNDTLIGTASDDWLIGGTGADKFDAGAANDLLVIDAEDHQADIKGGAGIDTVLVADDRSVVLNLAQAQVEVVYGGYGDDVFIGGGADNYFIDGAAGDDLIIGGSVDDVLNGADGNDIIQGGKGDDLIRGGRDHDQLLGGEGNDVLDGGLGNDTIKGETGNDIIIASGGTDVVDGGAGIDLLELQGNLEDYSFVKNADGSWTITDKKNLDGSLVDTINGKVSDRDGIQNIKNVERFSFMRGNRPTGADFDMAAPLPVNDIKTISNNAASYTISISSLLSNDIDFQTGGNGLTLYWVGDALGGTVAINGSKVIFTPTAGYKGNYEFNYKVKDPEGNTAPLVSSTVNGVTGELKGRVALVPNDAPTDPGYAKAWYLGAINVGKAWSSGYTGKGVNVLVYEPSGEFAVSQQNANLNDADFVGNKSDRFVDTQYHSTHATAVAGVIGAAKNGIGNIGVAYDVTLDSINMLPSGEISSSRRQLAAFKNYDIVNNSWIEANPWNSKFLYPGTSVVHEIEQAAIQDAALNGRNRLGTVMVFGAGNGREKGYDGGLSSLTNNAYTINVGAINQTGDIGSGAGLSTIFSQRGANILIAAPGSNIVTTGIQLTTADGVTIGDSTIETQGTSFATPIVSGVVALMLQANSQLSYRDVQSILAATARKDFTGASVTAWSANKDNTWNGKGMHFSHDFGFGMVDAAAAVRMAENWISEGNRPEFAFAIQNDAGSLLPDRIMNTNGKQTLTFTITEAMKVEQVQLNLQFDHQRWRDVAVTLISPNGTRSVLLDFSAVQNAAAYLNNPLGETYFDNTLMSTHFRGENSAGSWRVEIEDKGKGIQATSPTLASLNIVGAASNELKRYTLTDEYSGGWAINNIPVGIPSELNASALTGSVSIDISGSTGSLVNGQALIVGAGIDRLLGGAGSDTLIGSASNDEILGGLGNDTIKGAAGSDKLEGGAGDDQLEGGAGQDLLIAGNGNDTLTGGTDGDVFLVDIKGNSAGTSTTITDFSAGDTLSIRTPTRINWSSLTQTTVANDLVVSFNVNNAAGANVSTVTLKGLGGQTLDNKQLRTLSSEQQIGFDPTTGGYTGRQVVNVAPVYEIVEDQPRIVARFYAGSDTTPTHGFIPTQGSGYKLVHISEKKVVANPGEKVAIVLGPVVQDSNGNPGFASYYTLGRDVLSASWSGINASGGPGFLMEDHYSNDGHIEYGVDVHWRYGTDADELLVAGITPAKPAQISADSWNNAINGLGPRKYLAYGGNDEIVGGTESEIMDGGSGNDTITGGAGNDHLTGGADADQFIFNTGDGNDQITDLQTIDTLKFNGVSAVSHSSTFSNVSLIGFKASTQVSYGSSDSIDFANTISVTQFAQSSVTLYNKQVGGVTSAAVLDGITISNNADLIIQEKLQLNPNNISLLGGDDVLYALKNNQLVVNAGEGNDTLYALSGGDSISGGNGNDFIQIIANPNATQTDQLFGNAGDDTLIAGGVNTLLDGGIGDDNLTGGAGNDTLLGDAGNDLINGGLGNDSIDGGIGNDTLKGGAGDDSLVGGDGNDAIAGLDGADILHGGNHDDVVDGGIGNDVIYGDAGNDYLYGGDGDDTIIGGVGDDIIYSGSGADVIQFDKGSGKDTIVGLSGVDTIEFLGMNRSDVVLGLLNNGTTVQLKWNDANGQPNNVITLQEYNVTTKVVFKDTAGNTTTSGQLKDIFVASGYNPDGTFDYLSQYDTQLVGDTTKPPFVLVGSDSSQGDQLWGGPDNLLNTTHAAYSYVLGRGGNDALAGGLSGTVLDGGAGDDSLQGFGSTILARDTLRGGRDTLILPAGIAPESLVFSRVVNPLEVGSLVSHVKSFSDTYGYQTFISAVLNKVLNSKLLTPFEKMITGSPTFQPQNLGWFDTRYLQPYSYQAQRYAGHFDTLRIQTKDGRYVFDIANYFDSGDLKNDVRNLVFTTAFDAQGNSLNLDLSTLVNQVTSQNSVINKYDGMTGNSIDYLYGSVQNQFTGGLPKKVIGTEAGNVIFGSVGVRVLYGSPSGWSSIKEITSSQYEAYRSYSGNNPDVDFISKYFSQSVATSASLVQAMGLPDIIYGFGGNDTIDAGGAFYEEHTVGYRYFQRDTRHAGIINTPNREAISEGGLRDQVNGGDGNDTYIYRKGYGSLRIVSIDDANAGAAGIDTLDMSDFNRSEISFSTYSQTDGYMRMFESGSYQPSNSNAPDGGTKVYIEVDGGINGHLQVDYIKFKDITIDVRHDLIEPKWLKSPDGKTYHASFFANPLSQDRNLMQGVDTGKTKLGTPALDYIFVNGNDNFVSGNESQDDYVIDPDAVKFSVIQMDKGDTIDFSHMYLPDGSLYAPYWSGDYPDSPIITLLANASDTYLGKSQAQWVAAGVVPKIINKSVADFESYYSSSLTNLIPSFDFNPQFNTIYPYGSKVSLDGGSTYQFREDGLSYQFGHLTGLTGGKTTYSLENWVPISADSNGDTDLRLSWVTRDSNNVAIRHDVILADFDFRREGSLGNLGNTGQSLGFKNFGGLGDDYIITEDATGNTLYGNSGNDTLIGYSQDLLNNSLVVGADNIFYGGSGNDQLFGGAGDDQLFGGNDSDTIDGGLGNDTLVGGQGADSLIGGSGNDIYDIDAQDSVTELVGGGTDEVRGAFAIDLRNAAYANIENATLLGTGAYDLSGNEGNNRLTSNGVSGSRLLGMGGDDVYVINSANDLVVEAVNAGHDTVETTVDILLLAANVEDLTSKSISLSLFGNHRDNYIIGDIGNNILDGRAGTDTLQGLAGDDQYYVDSSNDLIIESAGNGIDTVWVAKSYALNDAGNNHIEIMRASSGFGVFMQGNSLSNQLIGSTGADTLDGGSGADMLAGGAGDDVYVIDHAGDTIVEDTLDDKDTVISSLTYTLGDNLENLTLSGTGAINATGNALDNILIGNNAVNILSAGAGIDTLDGGAGADTMEGGGSSDYYIVDNSGDVIIEEDIWEDDYDQVMSSVSYTLSAHVEILTLTGTAGISGTGNHLNNFLYGNNANNMLTDGAGNDALDGGLGADTMLGGIGDDSYIVDNADDVVIENLNEGDYDSIHSSVSYTLSAYIESLTLKSGFSGLNGTGNNLNNNLLGNEFANILTGLAGNDWLMGGDGADTLIGGTGDDNYFVSSNDGLIDIIVENAGEGTDSVYLDGVPAVTNYTLGANIENGYINSSAVTNLTGNTLNNKLYGAFGNDTLDGGSGADTLIGWEGDDTYIVDNTGDIVTESLNAGADSVQSSVSYTLTSNVENLTLTGTGTINGTGNSLDNLITGNQSNNTLNGGAGSDILQAKEGNDTLTDTSGKGLLDGGAGTDTLTAGTDNDILIGGLGNDALTTGTGYDVIAFNKGDGQDSVAISTGADNTLSLGGNFAYSDLSLTKSANDLILKMGASDQITFTGWYATSANKSVLNLQVIAEAIQGFSLGGSDALRNNKVETFNFANLVAAFDTAGATANWQLTDARLAAHLSSGSDTSAIGGDIAYQYGKNSNLAGIGMLAAQSVIGASSVGQSAQTLNNPSVWQDEVVKLT